MKAPYGYELDDDPGRIDHDVVWKFLSTQAYWARWRQRADVDAQIAGAWRVIGAYESATGQLVGFARAVSDGVAFAYLADVFVVDSARGRGLGKAIVTAMIEDGPGADFRWILHTKDAGGLYERYGFGPPDEICMERKPRR